MPASQPTLIRGQLYPSQTAAARALGVHISTINMALQRGTEALVGLGRRGCPGSPCYMNGKRWPSQRAAARALGVRPAAISRALAEGRTYVRPGGKGEFV